MVSNNTNNKHSDVVEVVYLTSQAKKNLPTHVDIMCRVPSTALCEQVDSVYKDRIGEYVRSCTDEEMDKIGNALRISLDLKEAELKPVAVEQEISVEKLLPSDELIKVSTERDVYKGLYMDLLEKMRA